MNRYVIGDIHGGYKALLQCLERSKFDYEKDQLISLGDIVDGWSESYECVEELLKIKNLIAIRGNHDEWFNEYIKTGIHGSNWTQGADATKKSYQRSDGFFIGDTHEKFFRDQINYYIDDDNNCFVHGGFNRHELINEQHYPYIYYWDRDLWNSALSYKSIDGKHKFKTKNKFKEVFIGHTTTGCWGFDIPMKAANIYNLDTGAGFEGKLTIMNVDTHEYYQSDKLTTLYTNERGRN